MIELDGSYGEGGGQILRSAIALSALAKRAIRISNIRAGRSNPGLRRQHLAGIEVIAKLTDAKVKGLEVGSTKVEFRPSEKRGGFLEYDIGTAGAISLLLQAALPVAVFAPEQVELHIRGGTDVAWSPPIDYIQNVFVPIIERMGCTIKIHQIKRGHYPKGGGKVKVIIEPVKELQPIDATNFGQVEKIEGISHCVRLPSHIAERQATSAEEILRKYGFEDITIERESYKKKSDPHLGAGTGIVIWAESDQGYRVGADALGARGKPAEKVGREAAKKLITEISSDQAVDSHLADMLVPYLALAKGTSTIGITKLTSHLETNVWVARKLLDVEVELVGKVGEPGTLRVHGIGSLP
ncbi:MAG: RNA 3'-terminal phosphate cyclase [Candidatus Thorarchaeota archaeon]|nr:MAG: RNA 3'-terminal phosphate cyclase [Candidatus Thorarchaeota archaeon]